MELFNAEEYFKDIAATNKLCVDEGFRFCTCSGLENLEEAIDQFRKVSNFFIFDDTTEGQEFRGAGGGYYHKRLFTVSLMRRYRIDDMADRAKQLAICRCGVVKIFIRENKRLAIVGLHAEETVCHRVVAFAFKKRKR